MTFPQLTTGALAQYPLTRRTVKRTLLTTSAGGASMKLADDAAAAVEWTLRFEGLSIAEWKALESFFVGTEGQLEAFTFVDPLGNMLAWSTDLTQTVWQRGPGLSISGGATDPFGTQHACRFTNVAQASQAISQAVSGPGGYQYSFSVYASAPAPETITLIQQSGSAVHRMTYAVTSDWQRYTASAKLDTNSDHVTFGVELEPGATVLLAAFQAEPQPLAGAYIPTFSRGSIYPHTRFLEDALEVISPNPDQFSCTVRLRSAEV